MLSISATSHNRRFDNVNVITVGCSELEADWLSELSRLRDRYESKVDVRGPGECWPWRGAIAGGGYGCFRVGTLGKRGAHRIAWMLAHGCLVPDGFDILHSCDNPPCCNPAHLRAGTAQDNLSEAVRKGRTKVPHPNKRRLTEDEVAAIRSFVECNRTGPRDGVVTEAARRWNVAQSYVSMLVRGKRRQYDAPLRPELEQVG